MKEVSKLFKTLILKIKDALFSVLPIVGIVLFLCLIRVISLTTAEIITFVICSVVLIMGIGLFNLGADLAMTPMGEYVGSGLTKTKKPLIVLFVCFIMGVLITIAEPDLSVLADQLVGFINPTTLIFTIGIGVGLFLLLAIIKIIFKQSLSNMLIFFYFLLFAICSLLIASGKSFFMSLAFDSGGVTTGPITVPFIMALGVGIASSVGGRDANENSFGLVALCSVGPIIAVMFLAIFATGTLAYEIDLNTYSVEHTLANVWAIILNSGLDVLKALGLVVVFFFVLNFAMLKLPKRKLAQTGFGIIYTLVGLILFLGAAAIGFMPVGFKIGSELAGSNHIVLALVAFIFGMLTVIAEPAVQVLNKQVEEITAGSVSKRSMMISLSIGVGLSICLSVIRIIFGFSILYYLIPGYIISLGLSFFVPKIYTSIAFDSGGVASGPLTSSFILPFMIGVCYFIQGEDAILTGAFGVVAMVALTPLITIQILGFRAVAARKVHERIVLKRILDKDDEQIIYF
ncbi:MAG: DUF1538 domain-containing protein [Bacilli bacterium]|nr:DUF1538 domain-containing protein [Bacilli bacterium]MBO7536345.1 DUF1538 domain-containing protein [Bacilli bacterium]